MRGKSFQTTKRWLFDSRVSPGRHLGTLGWIQARFCSFQLLRIALREASALVRDDGGVGSMDGFIG